MPKTDSTTITETRAARLRRLHGEGETGAPPDARSADGDRGSGGDDAGLDPQLVEELVPDPEGSASSVSRRCPASAGNATPLSASRRRSKFAVGITDRAGCSRHSSRS